MMKTRTIHAPNWVIDTLLQGLMGERVRVQAAAFSPVRWNGDNLPDLIDAKDLILPDNSRATGLPVFFEGRLMRFRRQIGVVYVGLEPFEASETAVEGTIRFRGRTAVMLQGPAIVKLAVPLQVERLPLNPDNYRRDLQFRRVQFNLPL